LHRDVVSFTGLTPATVVNEPFLAIDDIAWGWPGRGTLAAGLPHPAHQSADGPAHDDEMSVSIQ